MDRSQYHFSGGNPRNPSHAPAPPPFPDSALGWVIALGKYLLLALIGFAGWWGQDAIETNRATLGRLVDTQQHILRRLDGLDRDVAALRSLAVMLQQDIATTRDTLATASQQFKDRQFESRLLDIRYQELRKMIRTFHPGAFDPSWP